MRSRWRSSCCEYGRYRASGRGKPACELLERFAAEGSFPRISPAVDLLNAVSLTLRLPMSLVDLSLESSTLQEGAPSGQATAKAGHSSSRPRTR